MPSSGEQFSQSKRCAGLPLLGKKLTLASHDTPAGSRGSQSCDNLILKYQKPVTIQQALTLTMTRSCSTFCVSCGTTALHQDGAWPLQHGVQQPVQGAAGPKGHELSDIDEAVSLCLLEAASYLLHDNIVRLLAAQELSDSEELYLPCCPSMPNKSAHQCSHQQ